RFPWERVYFKGPIGEHNEKKEESFEKECVEMIGVELDMVVKDSLKALTLYEEIFEVERIEVTDLPRGENEVIFSLYDVRFHLLDEHQEFYLIVSTSAVPKAIWVH